MQAAAKVSWIGKTFALARCSDAPPRRSRNRRSKEERKTMVESFIKTYQISNNGNFPSLNLTHKEVGGSFYIVREIVREIIQENKVLGPGNPNSQLLNFDDFTEAHPSGNSNISANEISNEQRQEAVSISGDQQFYEEWVINPLTEESGNQRHRTATQEMLKSHSVNCASSELVDARLTGVEDSDDCCDRHENLLKNNTCAEHESVSQNHIPCSYQEAVVSEHVLQEVKNNSPASSEDNKNQDNIVQDSESISSALLLENNSNIINNSELVAFTDIDDVAGISDEDKSAMTIAVEEIDTAINTLDDRIFSADESFSQQNSEGEDFINNAGGPATRISLGDLDGELMKSNSILTEKNFIGNASFVGKYESNHAPIADIYRPVDEFANQKVGLNLATDQIQTLETNVGVFTDPGQLRDINDKSESVAKDELKNSLCHMETSNKSLERLNRKSLQDAIKNGESAENNNILLSAIKGLFAALVKFFTE